METEIPFIGKITYEETLYYPLKDDISQSSNLQNPPPNDDIIFFDKTNPNTKELPNSDYIERIDTNKFNINENNLGILIPVSIIIYTLLIAGGYLFATIYNDPKDTYGFIPSCVIFIIGLTVGLIFGLKLFYNIKVELEQNSIIMKKRALFRCKTFFYNNIDLERAEVYCKKKRKKRGFDIYFILYLILKSGEKIKINAITIQRQKFVKEPNGLKYFIDLINAHIQGGMKIYENL